jgi:hypothetical protein
MVSSVDDDTSRTAARFAVMPNVRACELDGELVLLDIVRGEYFGLDELGTRAWHHLQAGQTILEMARQLAPSYEVELGTLTRDLASFVRDLESAGLIGAKT